MIITAKRAIVSFFILTVISAAILFKIAYITDSVYSDAASQKSSRLLTIGQTRGMIYDRNMQPLVNREMRTVLVVNPTSAAMSVLEEQLSPDEYAKAQENAKTGKPFLLECDAYSGNCKNIADTYLYDRYSENDIAVHLIGYLDSDGKGVIGIEKAFNDLLIQHSGSISVRYNAAATGIALNGLGFEILNENFASSGGLVLTIDREIQRVCEEAMKRNNMKKGAAVVLDVATGEILALASFPSLDRTQLSSALYDEDSPFVNRTLEAYSVGSVFKPVVAVAALEQGISPDTSYNCTGSINVSGVVFNCHNRSGHGFINMTEAMAMSCNSYFIRLGNEVGAESILETAARLGFGRKTELCDSMVSDSGNLPAQTEIDSLPSLANLSFGQGSLLATPLQIAAMYCVFANNGYYREPYVLTEQVDSNGNVYAQYRNENAYKVLTDSVCADIGKMLAETVANGSGTLAKPMCYNAAGKTATAETGQIRNGQKKVHTWFAGYYPYEEPKYVIVVFREDGNSSSTDCAPVFRDIADGITSVIDD